MVWIEYKESYHCVSCGAKLMFLTNTTKISHAFQNEEIAEFIIELIGQKTSRADYKG